MDVTTPTPPAETGSRWLTGTKRRLYTIAIMFSLTLVGWQTWRMKPMDPVLANILIFTVGSTAAGYIGGRWAETQDTLKK